MSRHENWFNDNTKLGYDARKSTRLIELHLH